MKKLSMIIILFIAAPTFSATYYVDFSNGVNSNNGLSKNTPWKVQPYMKTFNGAYNHQAGDRFIFKGGTTWPSACFPATVGAGGDSPTKMDYYGVDSAWFAGASWSRPVFDGEYLVQGLISLVYQSYIIIDNFELKGINCLTNWGPGCITGGDASYNTITNCYIHGWTVTTATDDTHGGVIYNYGTTGSVAVIIDHCEITNIENSSRPNGACIRQVNTVRFSKLHDAPTAILFAGDIHDNEIYNIDYPDHDFDEPGTYHANCIYIANWNGRLTPTTKAVCYNNYLHDWGGGASPIYPNPSGTPGINIYNNVLYGHMSAQQPIEIDPYAYGNTGSFSAVYCYNNTIITFVDGWPGIHLVNRGPSVRLDTLIAINNHIIGTNGSVTDANSIGCDHIITSNNLIQTSSQAAAQGYTLKNKYAPMSPNSGTINAGKNRAGIFTSSINGVIRSQDSAWNIGAYEVYPKLRSLGVR